MLLIKTQVVITRPAGHHCKTQVILPDMQVIVQTQIIIAR